MKNTKIRKMREEDKDQVLKILKSTAVFSEAEIIIAEELIDSYLKNTRQKDYVIYVSEADKQRVSGYVCFGPTPCTENTYDIYWIAVDPTVQGRGLGGEILRFAEDKISKLGGRMIVVETSSSSKYKKTRDFYLAKQYHISAKIKDFYRERDDKIIFIKKTVKN